MPKSDVTKSELLNRINEMGGAMATVVDSADTMNHWAGGDLQAYLSPALDSLPDRRIAEELRQLLSYINSQCRHQVDESKAYFTE